VPFFSRVVVRRELLVYNDYGDLFLDRLLLALNPSVILDFDDDISAAKREPRQISRIGRLLQESPTKFGDSLRLYPRFIAGSEYLRRLVVAERGNATTDVAVIPTCVSYDDEPQKRYGAATGPITLGWIGTDGNLPQLERIVPELEAVAAEQPLRLIVISGQGLRVRSSLEMDNRRWSLATQIDDLLDVDIGLMPLVDSRVERGKCGFKQIQYMGLGIVGIASAITTNREIVTDGVDGFLVEPGDSWAAALRRALQRRSEFAQIGAAARETIRDRYSVAAHADTYVAFIAHDPPMERPDTGRGHR
jgi:glycosyltransferase involved in cell wall biosynthesis